MASSSSAPLQGALPPELDEFSARLEGPVAVRSSALGEDSSEASFAGQFETVLGVQGVAAIRDAVERCLVSAAGARAEAYRSEMHANDDVRMAVVVQRMVDATAAGVIFTADPVTGQRDRIVINAVPGLGEALVGGYRTPDHFVLSREGTMLERAVQGGRAAVDEAKLSSLLRDALKAEAGLGYPLDLEWAIGQDDQVYWLQARPITTLELPGPDELDDVVDPTWQLTTHNVAEWMPGAMPPLSWSVVGPSYIQGMNELYVRAGVRRDLVERVPCLVNVAGARVHQHGECYLLGSQMFGMDKESSDLTLTGHGPAARRSFRPTPRSCSGWHTRYATSGWCPPAKTARCLRRALRHVSRGAQRGSGRVLPSALEHAVKIFSESGDVHVHTSMMAIAFLDLFQQFLSKGGPPSAEVACSGRRAAGWGESRRRGRGCELHRRDGRAGQSRGADSGRAGRGRALRAHAGRQALEWLQDPSSGAARKAFESFLVAHGHRCIRELDFRERDWEEDPCR